MFYGVYYHYTAVLHCTALVLDHAVRLQCTVPHCVCIAVLHRTVLDHPVLLQCTVPHFIGHTHMRHSTLQQYSMAQYSEVQYSSVLIVYTA